MDRGARDLLIPTLFCDNANMLIVGLTGGICSGKSTVARLFSKNNVPLVDADIIAHNLVQTSTSALAEIVDYFGSGILTADNELNREKLRDEVFRSAGKKKKLESILHPRVFEEIRKQLASLTSPYCVVSIPLLIETGSSGLADRILVIDCPVEVQIRRVKKRDRLDQQLIRRIIQSQSSRTEKLSAADDVIINDSGLEKLTRDVNKLHKFYLSLAAQQAVRE